MPILCDLNPMHIHKDANIFYTILNTTTFDCTAFGRNYNFNSLFWTSKKFGPLSYFLKLLVEAIHILSCE